MRCRLNRFLAQAGIASRRRCDQLILEGLVSVNGVLTRELSTYVDSQKDIVVYKEETVHLPNSHVYLALYKPAGYLSTASDPHGRPIALDLLPQKERLYNIGRLDCDSEGLLLFTNNGDLCHKLTHPRYGVPKIYEVKLDKPTTADMRQQIETGQVELDGKPIRSCKISLMKNSPSHVKMTLFEGRKREIRRIFEHFGISVIHLLRISFGPIALKELKPGEFRYLSREEIQALEKTIKGGAK